MIDINRELAEGAAEEYSDDPIARKEFADGWVEFCKDDSYDFTNIGQPGVLDIHWLNGYIAARDAPDDWQRL